jgi:hypothetical protein
MVLDELHVFERRAGAIRQRHAVAGLDRSVRRERKHAAAAAGAEDDGMRRNRLDASRHQIDRDDALHAPVVLEQGGDEPLVVAGDARVLQRRLEERVQHVEAGLVGREPRAHLLHAAERTHADAAVGLAAPWAAPVLEAQQFLRRFPDERLDRVLIAQPVAARDGVVSVLVEGVVAADHAGGAALGRHGVASHRIDLRYDADAELRIGLGDRDCRPKSGAAAADEQHIVVRRHRQLFGRQELVDQNGAVVSNHFTADAAVVILVADQAASARVIDFLRDEDFLVLIFVDLRVDDLPARRLLALQSSVRQNHR